MELGKLVRIPINRSISVSLWDLVSNSFYDSVISERISDSVWDPVRGSLKIKQRYGINELLEMERFETLITLARTLDNTNIETVVKALRYQLTIKPNEKISN